MTEKIPYYKQPTEGTSQQLITAANSWGDTASTPNACPATYARSFYTVQPIMQYMLLKTDTQQRENDNYNYNTKHAHRPHMYSKWCMLRGDWTQQHNCSPRAKTAENRTENRCMGSKMEANTDILRTSQCSSTKNKK